MSVESQIYEMLLETLAKIYGASQGDIQTAKESLGNELRRKGYELAGSGIVLEPEKHFASVEVVVDGEPVTVSTEHEEDSD